MPIALNLEDPDSIEAIESLSIREKSAFAWKIIDEKGSSKGFSRKKLVPLHGAIMTILSAPGSHEELLDSIEKVLTGSEPARR